MASSLVFASSIQCVVEQLSPTLSLSRQASEFIHSKIDLLLSHMINSISEVDKKIDVTPNSIQQITLQIFPPTMGQWAIEEGNQAVKAFGAASKGQDRVREAGLVFPVLEIERLVIERHPKFTLGAAVFLTGIIEYFCSDLIHASSIRCVESERNQISLTDLIQATAEDEEISNLLFILASDSHAILQLNSFVDSKFMSEYLYTPLKKKSFCKLDNKPIPILEEHNSKEGEKNMEERKGLEDVQIQSWTFPKISFSSSIGHWLDGRPLDFESESSTDTSLFVSMTSEDFTAPNSQEKLIEKINSATKHAPPPMSRKDPRRRLSKQYNSLEDMMSSVDLSNSTNEDISMRNSSKNLQQSPHVGESVTLQINITIDSSISVDVPKDMTCGELLNFICYHKKLKFEDFILRKCTKTQDSDNLTNGEIVDPEALIGDLEASMYFICSKHLDSKNDALKSTPLNSDANTLYLSENGKDTLIMEVQNGRAKVISGSFEKLVERLADEGRQDSKYVDCILLTYRFFVKPLPFFQQLYKRYSIGLPPMAGQSDTEYFDEWQKPIQRKVINVIRWWVENYWFDFNHDFSLLACLLEFCELIRGGNFEAECDQLYASILSQIQLLRTQKIYTFPSAPKTSQFLTFEVRDLATQLTIWNFELFSKVQPVEYVNNIISKDQDLFPNLILWIKRFELESFWVATEICLEKDLRRRALILDAFIRIAKICRDSKNFFSTFSIVGGLNLSCVQRLKTTWAAITPRNLEIFQSLEELMSPYQNMKNYREKMATVHPPAIPVIPVYLKDLLFTHDGNKTFVNKLVNFEKFGMISSQIRQVTSLTSIAYERDTSPKGKAALEYIQNPIVIMDLMKLSQLCNEHSS